jgi:hypothetical protein
MRGEARHLTGDLVHPGGMSGRTRLRRGAIVAGVGALGLTGALVLTGGGSEEPAAEAAPVAGEAVSDDTGGWSSALDHLPEGLAEDLLALRDMPADERLEALQQLRERAAAGEFGDDAQRFAQQLTMAETMLPAELRGDLEDVVELDDPAAIRAELERIRAAAADGGYGAQVQAAVDRIGDAASAVPEDLEEQLGDLRELPSTEQREALEGIRDGALDGEYGEKVQGWAERLDGMVERHTSGG